MTFVLKSYCPEDISIQFFVTFLYLEMLEDSALAIGQCTTADLSAAVDTTKSAKAVPVSASSCGQC